MSEENKPELMKACGSEAELRAWLAEYLKLTFPVGGLCAGHCSPFDYVWSAYNEPGKDLVVWAPRGGGKTRLGAAATLLDLLHKPGIAVRILGGSLEQSMKMWDQLLPDIERLAAKEIVGKARAKRLLLENGSTAAVLTQSPRSVRGLRVQKLRCDEVDEWRPDVWEAAQLTTRTHVGGEERYAGVIEAISTFHHARGLMRTVIERANEKGVPVLQWCLMDVLEECPQERDCDTCPLLEDCGRKLKGRKGGFFSIDDAIAIKDRVSIETWQSEMMCRRPSTHGRVYPSFHRETHVMEQMPPVRWQERTGSPGMYLGVDFGFANPYVCLWIERDQYNRSFVVDEYIQSERTIDDHLEEMLTRPQEHARLLCCDPAGNSKNEQTAKSNVEKLKKAGYAVRSRGSHIQDGIELVRDALFTGTGRIRLYVHPRCEHLIKALESYRYAEHGELPAKDGNDHAADALRYYFVSRDSGKMEGRYY